MKIVFSATYAAALLSGSLLLAQSTPVLVSRVPSQGGNTFASQLPAANHCTGQAGLACVIPNLYGPFGLVLPNATHAAHFNSGFQSNFSALNSAIATQLTLLPFASPASGFTYTYDPASGGYQQQRESFGPVLTERAETIGKNRFYFGLTFQRFRFDKLDGLPLHNLPAVFGHQAGTGPQDTPEPYETQFISTRNSVDLKVNQFTIFGTYGITDRIDVSVAIPIVQIGLNVTSDATINRTVNTEPAIVNGQFQFCCSNGPPFAHFFDPQNSRTSLTHTFGNNQFSPDIYTNATKVGNLYWDPSRRDAAGLGDVSFRFKGSVYRSDRFNLALLTDLRVPSGDERNFLGSGAWGVKPFAAISVRAKRLTPHLNLGYQWNGDSLLAGDILNGTKATLPGFAFFSAGTDIGVFRSLTLAVDYLGQELINAPRISQVTYTPLAPLVNAQSGAFQTINEFKGTYNQSNAAVGAKYNLFGKVLLSGNLLIALNDGGLRERLVPLIGLSYTF